jgi:hypothetical protein
VVWLLVVPVCAAGAAGKGAPPPDPELLEFLGTFETAGGKGIDPLLLEKEPRKPAAQNGKGKRKTAPRKAPQEKTPPHGRDTQDE